MILIKRGISTHQLRLKKFSKDHHSISRNMMMPNLITTIYLIIPISNQFFFIFSLYLTSIIVSNKIKKNKQGEYTYDIMTTFFYFVKNKYMGIKTKLI